MSTTVQNLIDQLQKHHKPEDTIVFQYMVSEYTSYNEEEFAPIAEYLMDNTSFGEESTEFFTAWITEANDVLDTTGVCDTCYEDYDTSSREGRCGDCGDCANCCTHEEQED